ncbi:siderophore-interacting protein [Microbacterium ulmi]|uniref:Siderophore-interacting protein n=1 Tax=Microbacterium ulmi TaxID=179095 RepID=A0A7Y2LXG4_9MICO|nr:siderophore-interacting protein [Microbacterium ulmi]NII71235.1 NADPH-dependent ferric siderophore reductase [Microbacterium ulmi]NNH02540.1 siderophore-interacting protein [Microbacterium ulmi]
MTTRAHSGARRVPHPLYSRTLVVRETAELSPTMRRVLFDLPAEIPLIPVLSLAPADHVKLVFPDEDGGALRLPTVVEDRLVRPDGPPPVVRDYTVRAVDETTRVLTLDFVTHAHGPAGRWASRAVAGDVLGCLGPRGSFVFPGDYDRYLLGADETALPALARWLEEAPRTARVDAVVEVPDAASEQSLPRHPGAFVRWAHRDRGETLVSALAALDEGGDETFVWVAGEATQLVGLRRMLVRERGADKGRVDIDGYWKSGVAGLDHHLPLDESE